MIGMMSDDASFWNTHRIGRFWGPWFYKHAASHFKVRKHTDTDTDTDIDTDTGTDSTAR